MWRQQAGNVRTCKAHRECPRCYHVQLAPAGASDLVGIAHGIHVECEVKAVAGRETQDQQNWGRMIEVNGGIRLVSRSGAEFVQGLNERLRMRGLIP